MQIPYKPILTFQDSNKQLQIIRVQPITHLVITTTFYSTLISNLPLGLWISHNFKLINIKQLL